MITLTLMTNITNVKAHNDEFLKVHCEYEKGKLEYLQRVRDNFKKNYDENIVNLFNKGIIVIDDVEYPINDFFIDYYINGEQIDLHLICIKSDYSDILMNSNNKYEFNGSTRFKDSTAFIELINSDAVSINENKITIIDKEKAFEIVNNWDGMIHSLVVHTDAVLNKQVFSRGDNGGKSR